MPAKEATPFSLELDRRVEEGALGTLYEKLPDDQVRCYACAHRCLIKDGLRGICKVRYNRGGTPMVPRCNVTRSRRSRSSTPSRVRTRLRSACSVVTCTAATVSPATCGLRPTRECD